MLDNIIAVMKAIETATGLRAAHYEAHKKPARYIVWAEEGEGESLDADNHKEIQTITGTIDFFSVAENDVAVSQIQTVLNSFDDVAWSLNSIQYEDDTGYIHHEWVWQVIASG